MKVEDFVEVTPFPPVTRSGVVYVLFLSLVGKKVPIYIGQTARFDGRMEDYAYPAFKAQTDFKVGKAIEFLKKETGFEIVVGFRKSENRLEDEKEMIDDLREKRIPLLNDLPGYSYATADEGEQEEIVKEFCRKHWPAHRDR